MDKFGNSIELYDVYEPLGKGGFGVVYRAKCRTSGMEVAIKMIDMQQTRAAGMANRVAQEVAIHSRLKHPSILQFYNVFEENNCVYMVLELCHTGELQRYLKTTHCILSESEACTIIKQVVEGLLYLHSHQIAHRDLTLANLLLTKDMTVKIADFGMAIQLQRPDEKHLTMCGTPNYISPEVATRASHGLATDVWGLGIIIYTLLVGNPPFDTDDGVKSTLTRVVISDIEFPDHLNKDAKDLIASLLQKNPEDRMHLKKILEHPFIRKNQSFGSGQMKRCLSYDSGVASVASTFQSYNSYNNHGVLPPPPSKTGSFQGFRPSSPVSHRLTSTNRSGCSDPIGYSGCRPQGSFSENCSGYSGHVCPTKSRGGNCEPDISHSTHSNRFVPFAPTAPSCTGSQCSSIANKNSVVCGDNNCSHAWRQCKQQCSHIDSCGCLFSQKSCCSVGPKIPDEDNHLSNKADYLFHATSNSAKAHPSYESRPPQITESSERKEKIAKSTAPPINSKRLRPVRQKTKNVIVSILSSGEVCLEFIKHRDGHDRVWEVMRISGDGMRVVMYQPNKGKGVSATDSPPTLPAGGADTIFSYENIPEKHWKKYSYAYKFVDLVKSKTPKITYYSSFAKCFLMENSPDPDFEACFYKGGKITKSRSQVTIIEETGKSWSFDFLGRTQRFSPECQFMWDHFNKCLAHCSGIEAAMSSLSSNSEETFFPAIIGRRPPAAQSPLQSSNSNKENCSPQSAVNIPTIGGYETSIASTRAGGSVVGRSKKFHRQVMLPGIGNAVQLQNGQIQVNYFDSTKLVMNSKSAEVLFTDCKGQVFRYQENDAIRLPSEIRSKLSQMPKIIQELKDSG